jgi:N-acetylmuramate 1-kinase
MTNPVAEASVPAADVRLEQLQRWLSTTLGCQEFSLAAASTDASFRRYFRVTQPGQSWIAMDAPPPRENLAPFVVVAEMLTAIGVRVPRLMQREPAAGFLLMSDLGTRTYYDELRQGGDAEALYAAALTALVRIQTQGRNEAALLPVYPAAVLQKEAALFTEWFCLRHLQLLLAAAELQALQEIGAWLAQRAAEQPRVFVHRDYHSRNLMVCQPRAFPHHPGILDFQDAVQGPLTYDLVSLLRDCYLEWPEQQVTHWLEQFRCLLQASGGPHLDPQQLREWFDLMGVQRHLKAIGIFARLRHRDGKTGYLEYIPRALGYVHAIAARYRALHPLAELLERRVLPALRTIEAVKL